ncbi:hypothetical protein ACFYNY_19805 [Streptomyces sp. NPDC006530]|uniref:hypothetical protein n=1 Tax=Streptomyces sp. NPDC006530 TaxID=3364750 RepID=UPI00368348B1
MADQPLTRRAEPLPVAEPVTETAPLRLPARQLPANQDARRRATGAVLTDAHTAATLRAMADEPELDPDAEP